MGSTSSKEHVGGGGGGQSSEIRRIESAGLTTPGRGLYPKEAHVISDENAMDVDLHHPHHHPHHPHPPPHHPHHHPSSDASSSLLLSSSSASSASSTTTTTTMDLAVAHPPPSSAAASAAAPFRLDASSSSSSSLLLPSSSSSSMTKDRVPMVFKWEHGGRQVCITGTFNGWSKQVPMHRSGNDFTYIANLTRGKHAYKYVVDDEWRFAPDQPTVADIEGNINNFVDVSEFLPLGDVEMEFKDETESMYGRFMPDIDDYTKEPPPLPPHLRHIILNKIPPTVDSRLLPIPQHVALNHLYCTAIKDGMMVLGVTQRYKQKFVTTVYYSLMPGTGYE